MRCHKIREEGEHTVIILAGYMFSVWSIMPLARYFTNCQLYCIDGIADEEDHSIAFDTFNQRLYALIAAPNRHSVTLIGYSMGGFAAQYFASQYPDVVDSLVLLGSCHPTDHAGFCLNSSSAFSDYLFTLSLEDIYRITTWNLLSLSAKHDTGLMAMLREAFFRDPPSETTCINQLKAMAHLISKPRFDYTVPCLSVYAAQDLVIKPEYSIKSANSSNVEMEAIDGGHLFLYENPYRVFNLINNWLTRRYGRHENPASALSD